MGSTPGAHVPAPFVKEEPELDSSENDKSGFYLGTIAIGRKRLPCRIGLSSDYNMDKWGFPGSEPCGASVDGKLGGNIRSEGGFLLNQPHVILAEGGPR